MAKSRKKGNGKKDTKNLKKWVKIIENNNDLIKKHKLSLK